jgi:hypothetical protein
MKKRNMLCNLLFAVTMTLSVNVLFAEGPVKQIAQKSPGNAKTEENRVNPSSGLDARTDEVIDWQVLSSGGGNQGTSESYGLASTVGQTAVGLGSSESYILTHGFWQDFQVLVMGDADGSGGVDIDDIVFLIAYVFQGGPAPSPLSTADVDCSGGVDIDDIVYLIAYIFQGGFAPGDPDGDGVPNC